MTTIQTCSATFQPVITKEVNHYLTTKAKLLHPSDNIMYGVLASAI